MSEKMWREWVINSLDNNDDGPDVYVIGPNAHDVKVIEIGAVDELQQQLAAKDEEIVRLKAELWVAKDSALRTYDGLAEKADKYDQLKSRLDEAENILNKFADPLRGRGKMSGTIWCVQIEGEIYDELRAYLDKHKGGEK